MHICLGMPFFGSILCLFVTILFSEYFKQTHLENALKTLALFFVSMAHFISEERQAHVLVSSKTSRVYSTSGKLYIFCPQCTKLVSNLMYF